MAARQNNQRTSERMDVSQIDAPPTSSLAAGTVGCSSVVAGGSEDAPPAPTQTAKMRRTQYNKTYRTKHREQYLETRRNRRAKNKEKIREAKRAWYAIHSSDAVEYTKAWKAKHRLAARAHGIVRQAILTGKLVPQPCVKCGDTYKTEAHHFDYARPLDVAWMCHACHQLLHDRLEKAAIVQHSTGPGGGVQSNDTAPGQPVAEGARP